MSRLLLLVALLLPAIRAGAQRDRTDGPGPGTSAPSSGNCGLDPRLTPAQMKSMLQAVFDDVHLLTGMSVKPKLLFDLVRPTALARVHFPPPKRNMAGDLVPVAPEIYYRDDLCAVAHSLAEVALAFAHEYGHIAADYQGTMEKKAAELEAQCGGRTGDCFTKAIDDFKAKQETDADAYGLKIVRQGPYRAEADAAGQNFMKHLRDFWWAKGVDTSASAYPSESQRAEMLRSVP